MFAFLNPGTLREVLTQAVLQAPMFMTRWRWNASRALALLDLSAANVSRRRFNGCVPRISLRRCSDAIACQDNFQGAHDPSDSDHPLAQETIRDCLTEAMDLDGLIAVLDRIERGAIACRAIDTPLPSVFCHEILNANPYAFLDDAPLEERRARAVDMRRTLPRSWQARWARWIRPPSSRSSTNRGRWCAMREEFHDALLSLGWVPCACMPGWDLLVPTLSAAGRLMTVWQERRSWAGWLRVSAVRGAAVSGCQDRTRRHVRRHRGARAGRGPDPYVLGWMEVWGRRRPKTCSPAPVG